MHRSMTIADAIRFMFVENTKDQPVYLNVPQLSEAYDLFLFFVDLLCKGLVLLYGEGGRLIIDKVTQEQMAVVIKKLKNAGIELTIDCTQANTQTTPHEQPAPPQAPYIITPPGARNVSDYKLIINSSGLKYQISFNVLRNI